MRLDGTFTALLLLISGVSAKIVPLPTNVTVSCRNLEVKVSWEYRQHRLQTSFRVTLTGGFGNVVRETTELQYNLTPIIWTSEQHYMDNFYVTVAAVLGGNQSQPVNSQTFTFNRVKTAALMWELDFPPVDLNRGESETTLSFINPLSFYRELKQATKSDTASFDFNVNIAGQKKRFPCTMKEMKCKHDITLPDGEECVTLDGWLSDGNKFGQVQFKKTGRICVNKPAEDQLKLLIGLLAGFIILISLIITMICKVKAWMIKTPETLPSSLKPILGKGLAKYDPVDKTDHLVIEVVPHETPSVSCEEDQYPNKDHWGGSAGGRLYESSSEELGAAGWIRDEDSSVKTVCVSIDSEEEERSPYDCPHSLQVDLGDGEMATGYRG